MQTYIEPDQFLCSTPYEHSTFEFGGPDIVESYRTCRYLNHNLKLFLDNDDSDQVLFGFEVINSQISNHVLQVTIGAGKLIQDLTLVTSPEFILTRDISTWEANLSDYSAVIYTDFKFPAPTVKPTTIDPGAFAFTLGILNNTNNQVETVMWDEAKNKLILYAAPLDDLMNVRTDVNIEGSVYHVYDIDEVDGGLIS